MSDLTRRHLVGTCAFRLMPHDELADAPSRLTLTRVGDEGVVLSYEWTHAESGKQAGSLLVGGVDEDGVIEASWFDTFHHQPKLMTFTGRREGAVTKLSGEWAPGWGWMIEFDIADAEVAMTMCNVIPESARDMMPEGSGELQAGPYEVMVARWN